MHAAICIELYHRAHEAISMFQSAQIHRETIKIQQSIIILTALVPHRRTLHAYAWRNKCFANGNYTVCPCGASLLSRSQSAVNRDLRLVIARLYAAISRYCIIDLNECHLSTL
jgi:hypothetical protein